MVIMTQAGFTNVEGRMSSHEKMQGIYKKSTKSTPYISSNSCSGNRRQNQSEQLLTIKEDSSNRMHGAMKGQAGL